MCVSKKKTRQNLLKKQINLFNNFLSPKRTSAAQRLKFQDKAECVSSALKINSRTKKITATTKVLKKTGKKYNK